MPIEFGGSKATPEPIPWTSFVAKYLEASGNAARTLSAITGKGTLPSSTGGGTSAPTADGTPALPFRVFAEFELTITTTAPATAFVFGGDNHPVPITLNGQGTRLGLSPMQAHDLASPVAITLYAIDPVTRAATPDARLAKLVTGFDTRPDGPRSGSDFYPVGVWGPPGADVLVKPVPKGDVVKAGKLVVLVAGIDAPSVGPQIDYRQVKARPEDRRPLPLTATGTDRAKFLNIAGSLIDAPAAAVASPADAIALGAARIFADRDDVVRGGHSAVAKAAYRQDRAAPPMFGTLTDGLAKVNNDNPERSTITPPAPPDQRDPRLPFVAGHLTSGVGAAIRAGGTTVADGRLKRRPAPTVESVQGRLALHLPVSLRLAAPPAVAARGTVLASGDAPRTDLPGSMRSYVGGRLGTDGMQSLVSGLGSASSGPQAASRGRRSAARAAAATTPLRTGDIVTLQLPDAAIDVDEQRRPVLEVKGKARVVVLRGRSVLFDDDVLDSRVTMPLGATHVGVQSDGDADAAEGLSGWHEATRVARLGGQTAFGAGCVVTSAASAGPAVLQWDTAGSIAHAAPEVTTRFSRPFHTVAVALTGTVPATLDPTSLEVVGARLARDKDGVDKPPVAVSVGSTSVLVYGIVPTRETSENKTIVGISDVSASVGVVVTAGSAWTVTGVVASDQTPEELAEHIAAHGLAAATAKVLAVAGPGCTLTWTAPAPESARRARGARKSASPKVTTSKSAAPKATTAKATTAKATTSRSTTRRPRKGTSP